MRRKRCLALLLGAVMALSLCACAGKDPDMSIQPAQLTEEENRLLELLDVGMEQYRIFDFTVSDKVQSIQINTYELKNGMWEVVVGGGGHAFTDPKGRLALRFGKLTEGLGTALQGETCHNSVSYTLPPQEDGAAMSYATSALSRSIPAAYDQEIPLVIQVATTKSEIHTYDVDYFNRPEEYAKLGYEHVYAITVLFSRDPVSTPEPPAGGPAESVEPEG